MSTTAPDYGSKIAALLAKAEDPAATPQEAESYTTKAEALMVKWGISDAMLDAKRRKAKKSTEKIIEERVRLKGSWARGLVSIAFSVGNGLGTVRVLKSSALGSTMDQLVYFIGHESDVRRAITLFESLQLQALSARDVWWKAYDARHAMSPNDRFLAKRQFLISFGHAVGKRLRKQREAIEHEAVAESESTALVLVDRSEKVDGWLGERYPKLGKARGTSGSFHGMEEGHAAGTRANLGGTQVGSGRAGELA